MLAPTRRWQQGWDSLGILGTALPPPCSVSQLPLCTGELQFPPFHNQPNSQWGDTSRLLSFPWSVPMTARWLFPTHPHLGSAVRGSSPRLLDPLHIAGGPRGWHKPSPGGTYTLGKY